MKHEFYLISYKDHGIDDGNNESYDVVDVNVIASSIEESIKTLRQTLPKSLIYDIMYVEKNENSVLISQA